MYKIARTRRQLPFAIVMFFGFVGVSSAWMGSPPQIRRLLCLPHNLQDPAGPVGSPWNSGLTIEGYEVLYYMKDDDYTAEYPADPLFDYTDALTEDDAWRLVDQFRYDTGHIGPATFWVEKWCTCNNPWTVPNPNDPYAHLTKPAFIYSYQGAPTGVGISAAQVRDELQGALGAWKSALEARIVDLVIPITLSEEQSVANELDLTWKVYWVDEPASEALATTYVYIDLEFLNMVDVDISLNAAEDWTIGESESACDLRGVLVHELGHAMGLFHPGDLSTRQFDYGADVSVMYDPRNFPLAPYKQTYKFRSLCEVDGDAAAWLFCQCESYTMKPTDVARRHVEPSF